MSERDSTGRGFTAVGDRRRFPRLAGRIPLRFKVINACTSIQPLRCGVTVDIARGGIRFRTDAVVKAGEILAVRTTLPGRPRLIAALAEVLRVTAVPREGSRPQPARWEVGIRFLWSGWHDGEMQREISHFVREGDPVGPPPGDPGVARNRPAPAPEGDRPG